MLTNNQPAANFFFSKYHLNPQTYLRTRMEGANSPLSLRRICARCNPRLPSHDFEQTPFEVIRKSSAYFSRFLAACEFSHQE